MRSCSRAHLHAKCCHDRPEPADLVRFPGPSPPTGSDRRAGPPGRYIKDVFVQCALCCRASVQTSRVKQVSAFRSDLMASRDPGHVRGRRPRNTPSRYWQRKVVWIYFEQHRRGRPSWHAPSAARWENAQALSKGRRTGVASGWNLHRPKPVAKAGSKPSGFQVGLTGPSASRRLGAGGQARVVQGLKPCPRVVTVSPQTAARGLRATVAEGGGPGF